MTHRIIPFKYLICPYVRNNFESYDLLLSLWVNNNYLAGHKGQLNLFCREKAAYNHLAAHNNLGWPFGAAKYL